MVFEKNVKHMINTNNNVITINDISSINKNMSIIRKKINSLLGHYKKSISKYVEFNLSLLMKFIFIYFLLLFIGT